MDARELTSWYVTWMGTRLGMIRRGAPMRQRHRARIRVLAAVLGWTLAGVVVGGAWGQTAAPPPPAATATPELAARYRLHEQYTDGSRGARAGAESIAGHRVAFRETIYWIVENPQAAPTRQEATTHVIYRERPAEVSTLDERVVNAAVRRYETVRLEPAPEGKAPKPALFDNLTVWFETRPNEPALVLALTPERRLRDREYMLASRQVFVPALAFTLPELPLRVGESYEVSRNGAEALIGVPVNRGSLRGKLESVEDDPAAPGRKKAKLDLTGRLETGRGSTSIHALIGFSFVPGAPRANNSTVVDAPGRIATVSLAQEATSPGDDGNRRKMHLRRELVLERRTLDDLTGLEVPDPAPVPTVLNSWLTYADPAGRFQFEHPQEYQEAPPDEDGTIDLIRLRPEGPDVISIRPLEKGETDADKLRTSRFATWTEDGIKPVAGAAGWLPEALWPGRRVYRFEAALPTGEEPKPGGAGGGASAPSSRVLFDGYVVLSGQDGGLYVESTTAEDDPGAFRSLVELMIRSVTFDGGIVAPEAGPGPAPATAPAAPPVVSPAPATVPPPGS
jgi:hypothetical protein